MAQSDSPYQAVHNLLVIYLVSCYYSLVKVIWQTAIIASSVTPQCYPSH